MFSRHTHTRTLARVQLSVESNPSEVNELSSGALQMKTKLTRRRVNDIRRHNISSGANFGISRLSRGKNLNHPPFSRRFRGLYISF